MSFNSKHKSQILKVASLVTLTLQSSVLSLSIRYARTRSDTGPMFISSTAVVMTELVKLFACLFLVLRENNYSTSKWSSSLYNNVLTQPMDSFMVSVPSFAYIVQNNLLYVSASYLDAATIQVTYQLKILITATFTVVIMKRSLHYRQWIALVVLVTGVGLVQLSESEGKSLRDCSHKFFGFSAVLGACILSSFAGIYFEMILKSSSNKSVWIKNVQLSLVSLPIGFLACISYNSNEIMTNGWFYGYNFFVVYLICLQAGCGLVVALVLKYADNILKGFATSLAIVISCIFSMCFFNFKLTLTFFLGTSLLIASIFLYSCPSLQLKKSTND